MKAENKYNFGYLVQQQHHLALAFCQIIQMLLFVIGKSNRICSIKEEKHLKHIIPKQVLYNYTWQVPNDTMAPLAHFLKIDINKIGWFRVSIRTSEQDSRPVYILFSQSAFKTR